MDAYQNKNFIREDGSFDSLTNVALITEILGGWGVKPNGLYQDIEGVGTFIRKPIFHPMITLTAGHLSPVIPMRCITFIRAGCRLRPGGRVR